VHHHTFQINQPTRCDNFSSLLLDVYVQLNMFRASSRPSLGAQQLQWQSLVLPLERGGSSAVGRGRASRPGGFRIIGVQPFGYSIALLAYIFMVHSQLTH